MFAGYRICILIPKSKKKKMSIKKGMQIAWHKFLQTNFNVFMRSGQGIEKQRKYQHIEI